MESLETETLFRFQTPNIGNKNTFLFPKTKHQSKTAQSTPGNRNMFPFPVGMLWRRGVDWLRMSYLP
jgi:hypothetical protein